MPIGFPQNPNALNNRLGSLATGTRDSLAGWAILKTELDRITDGQFEAAPYNFDAGEVAIMRSAVTDMTDLNGVFQGAASVHLTGSYDYRTFSGLLWGFA